MSSWPGHIQGSSLILVRLSGVGSGGEQLKQSKGVECIVVCDVCSSCYVCQCLMYGQSVCVICLMTCHEVRLCRKPNCPTGTIKFSTTRIVFARVFFASLRNLYQKNNLILGADCLLKISQGGDADFPFLPMKYLLARQIYLWGILRHKPCQHLCEKKGLASQNLIFFHASLFWRKWVYILKQCWPRESAGKLCLCWSIQNPSEFMSEPRVEFYFELNFSTLHLSLRWTCVEPIYRKKLIFFNLFSILSSTV